MNKQDRKQLENAVDSIRESLATIEDIANNETEKFDNLPEGLQMGEMGEKLAENGERLESAHDEIESALDEVQEIIEN